jgi:endoglucanase
MAIETIRQIDTRHPIIVGGTDYNSIRKLAAIPEYSDPGLIYTFHFYDPHVFTHQGATWGDPSFASLSGVPFPADAKRMPPVPPDLQRTWAGDALVLHYEHDAALTTLRSTLDKAAAFSRSRDVPVFCGEFGAYMVNSLPADRVRWYAAVTDMLDKRGIARTSWDYFGGFGIFNTQSGGDFCTDLNTDVVRALGFSPAAVNTGS